MARSKQSSKSTWLSYLILAVAGVGIAFMSVSYGQDEELVTTPDTQNRRVDIQHALNDRVIRALDPTAFNRGMRNDKRYYYSIALHLQGELATENLVLFDILREPTRFHLRNSGLGAGDTEVSPPDRPEPEVVSKGIFDIEKQCAYIIAEHENGMEIQSLTREHIAGFRELEGDAIQIGRSGESTGRGTRIADR
ncbi:MAG: hypothetical protein AAF456_24665 [Planctomycetota bacterium]